MCEQTASFTVSNYILPSSLQFLPHANPKPSRPHLFTHHIRYIETRQRIKFSTRKKICRSSNRVSLPTIPSRQIAKSLSARTTLKRRARLEFIRNLLLPSSLLIGASLLILTLSSFSSREIGRARLIVSLLVLHYTLTNRRGQWKQFRAAFHRCDRPRVLKRLPLCVVVPLRIEERRKRRQPGTKVAAAAVRRRARCSFCYTPSFFSPSRTVAPRASAHTHGDYDSAFMARARVINSDTMRRADATRKGASDGGRLTRARTCVRERERKSESSFWA